VAKFAFWNIQRIGNMNPTKGHAQDRVGIFKLMVDEILKQVKPSFFVLAEVTTLGADITNWLSTLPSAAGYTGTFHPVVSTTNPCNYYVIMKNKGTLKDHGVVGSGVQRPYVSLQSTGGLKVAFAHLKSGGSAKTEEELVTFLYNLAGDSDALCGDLNLDYHANFGGSTDLKSEVEDLGFKVMAPSNPVSFSKEYWKKKDKKLRKVDKCLDFLIYDDDHKNNVKPLAVDYPEEFHALIDHAPVCFQIKTPDV
jgi:hypothetical protein